LLAPAVAAFFEMPPLVDVTRALAVTLVVQSFATVPLALLLRSLRFKAVAVADIVSYGVGFAAVGCLLAVSGAGLWALVGAYIGQATIQTAMLVAYRRHAIRWTAPRWAMRDLLIFGSGHTLGRYLNYAALQGDFVVVGRCISDGALGVYGRAYQLATAPAMIVGGVLDKVLFPTLSARQDEPARLANDYRRAVGLSVSTTAPLGVLLALLAPEFVMVILGSGWTGVVVPLQILALTLVFRTGYKVADSLAKATGAVFSRAARQALYAVAVVAGAYAAHPWGLPAVAVAVSAAILLNYVAGAALGRRLTALGWLAFAAAHGRGLFFALLTAVGGGVATALARFAALPAVATIAVGTLGALLVVVGPAAIRPRLILGDDLLWLLEQLTRRPSAARRPG
jgi:PST family polysaccharide transporter